MSGGMYLIIDGPGRGEIVEAAGRAVVMPLQRPADPARIADDPGTVLYREVKWALPGHNVLRLLTCKPYPEDIGADASLPELIFSEDVRRCIYHVPLSAAEEATR